MRRHGRDRELRDVAVVRQRARHRSAPLEQHLQAHAKMGEIGVGNDHFASNAERLAPLW